MKFLKTIQPNQLISPFVLFFSFLYLARFSTTMSLRDILVCQFPRCVNRVYKDARLLPCGNRVCAEHIEDMLVAAAAAAAAANDDVDSTSIKYDTVMTMAMATSVSIRCHFCHEIHEQRDGKEFPPDRLISIVLEMKHCDEHDAAKSAFYRLSQQLTDASRFDKRNYLDDYFKRVESQVELEREEVKLKLEAFYDKLLAELDAFKAKCLHNLEANLDEFDACEKALAAHTHTLRERDIEFGLRTVSGDDSVWRSIRAECASMSESVLALEETIREKLIVHRPIRFEPLKESINFASICGSIDSSGGNFDSLILESGQNKWSLRQLCRFDSKTRFRLLYRASRDGFTAADFHAKCDNKAKTLTIIKSLNANIFGGFTSKPWDGYNGNKEDPSAFIFSMVNKYKEPRRMPIRAASVKQAIWCGEEYGPRFGEDIQLLEDMSEGASNLNNDYEFVSDSLTNAEILTFLAGSASFKATEIEVFAIETA